MLSNLINAHITAVLLMHDFVDHKELVAEAQSILDGLQKGTHLLGVITRTVVRTVDFEKVANVAFFDVSCNTEYEFEKL